MVLYITSSAIKICTTFQNNIEFKVYLLKSRNYKILLKLAGEVWRLKHVIYWLLCFEQVSNQLISLPNKGLSGGRCISFAPLIIDRSIS